MARKSNSKSKKSTRSQNSQNASSNTLVPSTLSMRNIAKSKFVTSCILTGGNVTPATTTGYSYLHVSSGLWSSSSPWTQLIALYQFVKPLGCRITITFNRATGNSDNPRVTFVPTPAGNAVGSLAMNLSTFEASLGRSFIGGPGQSVSFNCDPSVLVSVYNTVSNGYMSQRPGTLSVTSLPLVYYGDLLFYTPGILLSSVTQYVQIKIEFSYEFSVLANTTQ